MAAFKLQNYLQQVNGSWLYSNGDMLAAYLSYRHDFANKKKIVEVNFEPAVKRYIDKPVDEVVLYHLKCEVSLANGDVLEAFYHQYSMLQAVTKIFQSQRDQNWTLKLVQTVCLELRLLAGPADIAANNAKHPVECMEKTAEGLMACFRICAADNRSSEQDTKKWGMLMLVNQMLKVYFKINRHQLCKPLVRAVESCPLKERFSLAQRITYKFYTGQRAMFSGDYKEADECLSFCFQHCHAKSTKNKRSILMYLVPVKIMLGHMPKKSLLEKYELTHFSEVVDVVKQGNLARLSDIIDENRALFIKHSIFVIMQRLITVATRNLLKKVEVLGKHLREQTQKYFVFKSTPKIPNNVEYPTAFLIILFTLKCLHTYCSDYFSDGYHIVGSHQVPVEMFLKALLMSVKDASWEEAECLLANLIVEGIVKGYISSLHDMLVVSKTNPFPLPSSIK